MTRKCFACGDPADKDADGDYLVHNRRECCEDCYAELKFGAITNQNVNFFGGIPATAEDDASPAQANAIRHMEG